MRLDRLLTSVDFKLLTGVPHFMSLFSMKKIICDTYLATNRICNDHICKLSVLRSSNSHVCVAQCAFVRCMGRIFTHKGKCPAKTLCTRWSPVAGKYCRCCCKGTHRSAACISAAFVSATVQVGSSL
jgi:hypothetical protein